MRIKLAIAVILVFAFVATLVAGTATLAWDHSTATNVVTYRIYYGPRSGVYTNMVEVGYVTTATVSNLVEGAAYYFAATAVSAEGLESEYSNEASCNAATNSAVDLTSPELKVAR